MELLRLAYRSAEHVSQPFDLAVRLLGDDCVQAGAGSEAGFRRRRPKPFMLDAKDAGYFDKLADAEGKRLPFQPQIGLAGDPEVVSHLRPREELVLPPLPQIDVRLGAFSDAVNHCDSIHHSLKTSVTVVVTFRLTFCDNQSYKAVMEEIHPIRAYRERQNPPMSQGQFAGKVGVTRFTVMRWEAGGPIDVKLLPAVSQEIGIAAGLLRPDLVEKHEEIFGAAQ